MSLFDIILFGVICTPVFIALVVCVVKAIDLLNDCDNLN